MTFIAPRAVLGVLFSTLALAACHGSQSPTSASLAKSASCEGYPRANGSGFVACETRDIVDVATQGQPRVASTNSDLVAEGAERSTISGTAYVFGSAATQERAQAIAASVTLVAANDDYHGEPPADLGSNESWGIGFQLSLPAASSVSGSTANGNLGAAGFTGEHQFSTANGSMALVNLAGRVQAASANGDIEIALGGSAWEGEGVDAQSSNGSVRYFAPEGYNARFTLQSTNGDASSEFDGASCSEDSPTESHCEITLGTGGALLHGESTNGNAELLRQ